jgi:head-tail adaptor
MNKPKTSTRDFRQFRDLLTVTKPIRTGDGYGGESVTWETVNTVWAHVQTARIPLVQIGDRVTPSGEILVTVRLTSRIVSGMRFTWVLRVLTIVSIDEYPTDGYMVCRCSEVVA